MGRASPNDKPLVAHDHRQQWLGKSNHANRQSTPNAGPAAQNPRPSLLPADLKPQLVQTIGLYPAERQNTLENTRLKVPTYLLRGFSALSGSGVEIDGHIVPRAFLKNPRNGHKNIYRIRNLRKMCDKHLHGRDEMTTEFSSWSASISVAMHYLSYHHEHEEARLSVIDTRKSPEQGMYLVRHLYDAGFALGPYDHEYFVHGIINGGINSGYRSVLWSDLVAKKIERLLPANGGFGHMSYLVPECGLGYVGRPSFKFGDEYGAEHEHEYGDEHGEEYGLEHINECGVDIGGIPALAMVEVRIAKRVASAFGSSFVAPVMAALLSHYPRNWQRPDSGVAMKEVELIADSLGDSARIEDYSKVDNIASDAAFTEEFVETKQMIILLRLLGNSVYGNVIEHKEGEEIKAKDTKDTKPAGNGVTKVESEEVEAAERRKIWCKGKVMTFWARCKVRK